MRGRIALQKHFVRNSCKDAHSFCAAFGVRTRPRVAFASQPQRYLVSKLRIALFAFLTKKRSDRTLLGRWLECVNETAKPLGENFRTKFPVMRHARRSNVMLEESTPSFP